MILRVFWLLVAVLALAAIKPSPRVAFLKPIPRIVSSQDQVTFTVRVEPDQANRLLITAAIDQDGEVVRRSDEDLPGADAPRTRWIRWASLPSGDLSILAEVWDNQKPLGRATIPLCVRSTFEDLCPSLTIP